MYCDLRFNSYLIYSLKPNVEHFASGFLYSFARALAYVARTLAFVACVFMSPQYSEHASLSDAI